MSKSLVYKTLLLVVIVVPFLGVIVAFWQLWDRVAGPKDLLLLAGTFVPVALGITVGYHRHFTHASFQAHPVVRVFLGILGLMAIEGKITRWVADHRKHHQFSDRQGDLHSPTDGLLHAHLGWLFGKDKADVRRYGKDLLEDPLVQTLDRFFPLWVILSLGTPFLLGGWQGFLWGGLVRVFLVHHFTWSINSICHVFGARPYRSGDNSGNVSWLLLSLGENYHNTHHAFPRSARHGTGVWNDMSWGVIRILQWAGLAWSVNLPSEEDYERKRAA